MLGFQFLATVSAKLAGAKDVDFMPHEGKALLSLDVTESFFRNLAEQSKRHGT